MCHLIYICVNKRNFRFSQGKWFLLNVNGRLAHPTKAINYRAEFIILFFASFSSMPRLLCVCQPSQATLKSFFILLYSLVTVITSLCAPSSLKWYLIMYILHTSNYYAFTTNATNNVAVANASFDFHAFMCERRVYSDCRVDVRVHQEWKDREWKWPKNSLFCWTIPRLYQRLKILLVPRAK